MTQEVERLFDLLADLDAAARKSYFAAHDTEPVIQREVESLLAHDRTSTATLVMPIAKLAASGLPDASAAAGTRRCGPCALVQLIGRGGMGTVFRAERVDGEVHQQVAVKLMCGDCRDPLQRQRFLQERQILASLSHPNIASLLDAGHDADGQPYLVMELVEGRPIDEFCEGLATRQKIELFLQVCDAVSFAHSRLVVHRDIKPGNILVTAGGVPKLLDFGIAKMLGFDAGVTLAWQRVMTPVYGGPEQAVGGPKSLPPPIPIRWEQCYTKCSPDTRRTSWMTQRRKPRWRTCGRCPARQQVEAGIEGRPRRYPFQGFAQGAPATLYHRRATLE